VLPSVDQIAKALGPIVKTGLPVSPGFADEMLLGLPSVLIRSHDPDDRLSRIKALDELLREHLDRYPGDALREVARVLFGVTEGSRGQPIGVRRKVAATMLSVLPEHVRTGIQPKVLKALAWELHRDSQENAPLLDRLRQAPGGGRAVVPVRVIQLPDQDDTEDIALSARAGRAGRQLYRYAQNVLLIIDAYEACSRCEKRAESDHPGLRVVPARRTIYSDEALWMFAYSMKYLRELKSDPAARAYLREHVSIPWWELAFLRFGQEFGPRLEQTRANDDEDSPRSFMAKLGGDPEGAAIAEEWLAVLTGHWLDRSRHRESDDFPADLDRFGLREDLLEICAALQHAFPEDTLSTSDAFDQYHSGVFGLATWGRENEGLSCGEMGRKGAELVSDALDNPPRRYAARSKEQPVVWAVSKTPEDR